LHLYLTAGGHVQWKQTDARSLEVPPQKPSAQRRAGLISPGLIFFSQERLSIISDASDPVGDFEHYDWRDHPAALFPHLQAHHAPGIPF
jgi:hypothetical protein